MRYAKLLLAAIVGFLAGGTCVALVQLVGNSLYPPPADIDFASPQLVADWVKSLPPGVFWIVIASWCTGAAIGPFVTGRISPERTLVSAFAVWLLFGAATLFTLSTIPHPAWVWFFGLSGWIIFGLLGLATAAPTTKEVTFTRVIEAPMDRVFLTLSQPEHFSEAIPNIIKIEIVSATKSGVGTRFRESRDMNGKLAVAEMEITELVNNHRLRLVSELAGTTWDSLFALAAQGNNTHLELHMIASSNNLASRLMTPLLFGFVAKAIDGDMAHIKAYCERSI